MATARDSTGWNIPLSAEQLAATEEPESCGENSEGGKVTEEVMKTVFQINSLDQNRTIKMTLDNEN